MMDSGYEGKTVNDCIYHLAKQNIFEPKKLRLLQHIGKIDRPPEVVIFWDICTFGVFQVFSIIPTRVIFCFCQGIYVKFTLILQHNILYNLKFDTNPYLRYSNLTILRYFNIFQTA
jgi:hypothetical protein